MAKQYWRITREGRLEFSDKRNAALGFVKTGEPKCCRNTPVPHNPVASECVRLRRVHCTCDRCF